MVNELRKATEDDLTFAQDCAESAYALYIERIGKRPAPMDQDFAAAINADELNILESDNQPVGYVLCRAGNDSLFVENVALLPAAQGKGMARWLFATLEEHALRLGLTSIDLYTNAKMHENVSLYSHLGFQITDRRSEHGFDRIYFRKTI